MGCFGAMARSYVKRPCCMFWSFLILYLLLSFLGVGALMRRAQENGQTSPFSEGTQYGAPPPLVCISLFFRHRGKFVRRPLSLSLRYARTDWSVSGKESVVNGDKVRTAWDVANDDDDYPATRRRLQSSDPGSGDAPAPSAPERSTSAGGRYSIMFLYFAKDASSDVFTPSTLQQMCQVENVVLGMEDYGKVCYNSSSASMYTTDGSGPTAHTNSAHRHRPVCARRTAMPLTAAVHCVCCR